jgi:hypothetical protein
MADVDMKPQNGHQNGRNDDDVSINLLLKYSFNPQEKNNLKKSQ